MDTATVIWLVVDYDYEDSYIRGAFTTETFADEWSKANPVEMRTVHNFSIGPNDTKLYPRFERHIEEHDVIK